MRKGLIIAAAVVQAAIVAGMLYMAMEPLRTGRLLVVEVQGVDPRDIMRGQYVELSYPFSTVSLDSVTCDLDRYGVYRYGDVVYVSLDGTVDPKVRTISLNKPEDDGPYLKGRIPRRFSGSPLTTLDVEYGIESYFTNPDRADDLDSILIRSGRVRVHLRVDDDGDARIADLEVIE